MRLTEAAPDVQHMSTELVAVHKSLGVEWVQPGTTDGLYPSHYVVWLKNNSVIFVALNDVRGGFYNDLNYVNMFAYGIWRESDSNKDQFLVQRHIKAIEHHFFQRYKKALQEAEVTVDNPTDANLRPLVDKRITIRGKGLRCKDGLHIFGNDVDVELSSDMDWKSPNEKEIEVTGILRFVSQPYFFRSPNETLPDGHMRYQTHGSGPMPAKFRLEHCASPLNTAATY